MLNEIILHGRLTDTPELKTTNSGKSVCSFTLAVERDFSTDGDKITDFINIVAWNKTAEFVSRYFTKGKQMIVKGSLQTRKYQTQNGENRTAIEVVADKVYFAGDNAKAPAVQQNVSQFEEIPEYGDLPF
ncbi:MAG: single-stranded DNA-binding protein [Bacteroidaceae bacterium]|nr:single-stranded DNA-binding protein [Bacteroidaceae bacterium]